MNVLITGANGFVGAALMERLARQVGCVAIGAARHPARLAAGEQRFAAMPDLGPSADWRPLLNNVDVVVHCAARVHVMRETDPDPLAAFVHANTDGTLQLARQAAENGVGRFVFVSSIGVHGATTSGQPFCENDDPAPHSPYAVSKHLAEQGLREISKASGLEVTIVRPVLIYGRGAHGNLQKLARLVQRGVPLPFASVRNRRTLVSAGNLADLLAICASHPAAAGEAFISGDPVDISTPEIIMHMARSLGVKAQLVPFPTSFLRAGLRSVGKADMANQLLGSLQVDTSKARRVLGWVPPERPDTALWA